MDFLNKIQEYSSADGFYYIAEPSVTILKLRTKIYLQSIVAPGS